MTWLILGGSGQLGRALQQIFKESNIPFVAPTRDEVDITKITSKNKITSYLPTAIINAAAWTDVDGAESHHDEAKALNCDGARNLADCARALDIPFLHVSTDYVFSGEQNQPWKVNSETRPNSFYGITKRNGEEEVHRTYPDGSYIIRTAWLYSPWRKNFVKTMLKRALTHSPSRVVADQIGQPTSAIDLARQISLLLTKRPKTGIYHGTNSGQSSWFEFAQEIYRLAGAENSLVIPIPTSEFPTAAARPPYSVLDHSEWNLIGIEPMRNWKNALTSVFPEIRKEVERELVNG